MLSIYEYLSDETQSKMLSYQDNNFSNNQCSFWINPQLLWATQMHLNTISV
jgi:hypothetical protein